MKFWFVVLGLSFLAWCVLVALRLLAYWGAEAAANGWDRAREAELLQMMRRGRRSQQVLAVSLRTALGAGEMQCSALIKGETALRAQTSWQERSARHSRLAVDEALPLVERLREQLVGVLEELAVTLEKLPASRPLALVLEPSSAVEEQQLSTPHGLCRV
ncbi:hypothetical protein [Pseudomonas delhiensis]|uniref:hypothetical protein n=1 Tax=Pseudomonas delhiensis TaxID=366289 RepID=UPI000B77BA4D|nr:hypothetical protein [Pseudomonas delhiensis]